MQNVERGLDLKNLIARLQEIEPVARIGRVTQVQGTTVSVSGLSHLASVGDRVRILCRGGGVVEGEVLNLLSDHIVVYPDGSTHGVIINDRVQHLGSVTISPDFSWLGRIVDPDGRPLDGQPLMPGTRKLPLFGSPPAAAKRRGLGERLETGMCVFNTLLPLAKGQRLGLFAGSGVGKSTLLSQFARSVKADVIVIALVGERGRELREFVENVLGAKGMERAVVVAATSDQSAFVRRRCAWAAMSISEYFRDAGAQVLTLVDSVTRFAEAHREIALSSGEPPSLGGYPPSVAQMIMSLAERAGPGTGDAGDITAIFSVLVAGSDMEEPIADILRGTLDGHIVLDRAIAERGRFPAVDLLRSVSRSLPQAASDTENTLLAEFRALLGVYDRAEMMLQAGLYTTGSDPEIDRAAALWSEMDTFMTLEEPLDSAQSFKRLHCILTTETA